MTIDQLTSFLGWCTVINFALLIFATLSLKLARKWIVGIHGPMFGLGESELSVIYFKYLAYYKIAIFVFNLSPYLALRIIA